MGTPTMCVSTLPVKASRYSLIVDVQNLAVSINDFAYWHFKFRFINGAFSQFRLRPRAAGRALTEFPFSSYPYGPKDIAARFIFVACPYPQRLLQI